MIEELLVENIAIIHRAQIELGAGFSALTGETGAGKSLLMDALELALGERADSDLVRAGAAKASVSLVVNIANHPSLLQLCDELGVTVEQGRIYIDRDVYAEGRSQARISGKSVPIATLRMLGKSLVDLHGQHQHQALLDPLTHVDYLDNWIGEAAIALRTQVAEAHHEAEVAKRKLDAFRKGARELAHRVDLLKFQTQEIEEFGIVIGEEAELETTIGRLRNVDRLANLLRSATESLSEGEPAARDLVGQAQKEVTSAAKLDESLSDIEREITDAAIHLNESIHLLDIYLGRLEADPEALENAEARMDGIKRFKRKYGEDEAQILAFLATAQEELAMLQGDGANEEFLADEYDRFNKTLIQTATKLTELRAAKRDEFATSVRGHMRELSLERAELEIKMTPWQPNDTGAEFVEFMFSANPGEPLKPLAKIASGGEISRVMLALKSVLAGKAGVPTLLFDEVDTGLGGVAASAVGLKLRELSKHYQVITISHLPQVASKAHTQYRIEKSEADNRVQTSVRKLTNEERVEEIARMIAGEAITETAKANAREMLL